MSTNASDFDLSTVDMMYAVSQWNLNEGLADYITSLGGKATISWAFDYNSNNQPVPPANPAEPDYSFTGTITVPAPAGGGPQPWILDLSQAGTNNQVMFTLAFENATFTNNMYRTPKVYATNPPAPAPAAPAQPVAQWQIPYMVQLQMVPPPATATLPAAVSKAVTPLQETYGDVFDLNQILVDLTTVLPTTNTTLATAYGFDLADWFSLVQCMGVYLAANAETIFPAPLSAAYTNVHNGSAPKTPLPTFTPTAATFVVAPNTNSPEYSALIIPMMVGGDPMPANVDLLFGNVALFSDMNTPGIAMINGAKFTPFLTGELASSNLLTNVSVQLVPAFTNSSYTWSTNSVAPSPGSFTDINPPVVLSAPLSQYQPAASCPALLSWSMAPSSTSATNNDSDLMTPEINATTKSYLWAAYGQSQSTLTYYDQLVLAGTLVFDISYSQNLSPLGECASIAASLLAGPLIAFLFSEGSWNSPDLVVNWNCVIDLEDVNDSGAGGGGVKFVVNQSGSSFPGTATAEGSGSSGFLASAPSNYASMLSATTTALEKEISSGLIATVGNLGCFVFPGGQTFTFQDPLINSFFHLFATIGYQNPA